MDTRYNGTISYCTTAKIDIELTYSFSFFQKNFDIRILI